ncbi:MAG TPA: JAB domain-containing protein [bacterium]|nr:JAB domain-containing protein [bacterium]
MKKEYFRMTKKQLLSLLASSNLIGEKRPNVKNSEDAVKTAATVITNWQQENFVVIYLDAAGHPIDTRVIFIGTLNQSLVHPRETFAPAIELRAASVILAHNHPAGTPDPSAEDLAVTKRLIESGKILGIEVLDHVIITVDSHYSFRQSGLI